MTANPSIVSRVVEWFTDPLNWSGTFGIPARLAEHSLMSGVSVALAAAVALPVALYIGHRRRFEALVVSIGNLGRAIPSFGLLFLFVVWLGIGLEWPAWGRPPVILALLLLAIPPIVTNTYVGIQGVDADAVEAARGMGMSEWQVLWHVEIPLAAPLVVAGVRTAAVQVVATATLAAVVAGGGLGRFIVDGFAIGVRGERAVGLPQVIGGAILVAALAIVTELAFAGVQRLLLRTPVHGRAPEPFRHAGQAPPTAEAPLA